MTTRISRWLIPALCTVAGAILGVGVTIAAYPSAPSYEKLPACAHEDGNLDGKPCWWTDPDTGTRYYVSSENYR